MGQPVKPLELRNGAQSSVAVRRALVCAAGFALILLTAGCTGTTSMLASMPASMGGLPADAPARPANDQTSYPAVHDMPPPRTAATLTPEQVKAVESEIAFARERQKAQARGASTSNTEER